MKRGTPSPASTPTFRKKTYLDLGWESGITPSHLLPPLSLIAADCRSMVLKEKENLNRDNLLQRDNVLERENILEGNNVSLGSALFYEQLHMHTVIRLVCRC